MSQLCSLHGSPDTPPLDSPLRNLYHQLLQDNDQAADTRAAEFLHEQLEQTGDGLAPLPEDPAQLLPWLEERRAAVARDYRDYLQERQAGGARRYFRNKAHALYFLQAVAPTKEVDGAWLYGVLAHGQDPRYDGLLTTYLEELGDGEPAQNHVAIYRRLLAEHGCDGDFGLDDELFRQGAVQLALGRCAETCLPEVLGYNLGYEQLPLHLLISAYELGELGIDPYYFTLHVTIDNASCGHARRAVQAVQALQPLDMDPRQYWQRVARGYRLNDLGPGSTDVIQAFDLEHELVAMLERKRRFGQYMHSDYCRFEGKSVNQWLEQPGQIPAFLRALQERGWIKRQQNPADSPFWQLIEGPGAAMFGVFSGFEKQLLHDWIAGDWRSARRSAPVRRASSLERSRRDLPEDAETRALQAELAGQDAERQRALLLPWLGPHRHFRPAGLFATRRFIELRTLWR